MCIYIVLFRSKPSRFHLYCSCKISGVCALFFIKADTGAHRIIRGRYKTLVARGEEAGTDTEADRCGGGKEDWRAVDDGGT